MAKFRFLTFVAVAALTLTLPQNTFAARLNVSPDIFDVLLLPGEERTLEVTLVNPDTEPRRLTFAPKSFVADAAGEKVVLDPRISSDLLGWLSVEEQELSVPAGGKLVAKVSLKVPENASLGAYQAALLFRDVEPQPAGEVNTIAEVGPLLLLNVGGADALEIALLSDFRAAHDLIFSPKNDFSLTLENTGDAHVEPIGVLNISGGIIPFRESFNFNDDRARVLAGNKRSFQLPWQTNQFLLGMYTVELVVAYGANNTVLTSTVTFTVIPWQLLVVLAGGAGIFLVIWLLRQRQIRLLKVKQALK